MLFSNHISDHVEKGCAAFFVEIAIQFKYPLLNRKKSSASIILRYFFPLNCTIPE